MTVEIILRFSVFVCQKDKRIEKTWTLAAPERGGGTECRRGHLTFRISRELIPKEILSFIFGLYFLNIITIKK